MSGFSTFGSMMGRGSVNVNSINYISKYAKIITNDFSGSSFTDLSATPSYALTAGGLNMTNGNTTFSRLKYNNALLKTTDFAPSSSSSFTIYLKHAARYSSLCPFNFQNPNVATVSDGVVLSGSDFSANFYSLLNPGTPLSYDFSGCTSAELNATSLTGTVTAPYGTVTKRFIRANYAIFPTVVPQSLTISCGAPLPVTTYTVTAAGGLFYINGSRPLPTMTAGNVYLFDQSNSTNIGNTLVFGTTLDSPSYYTSGVFTNGTAGSAGAYTLVNYTSATLSGLLYYSRQTAGMGYLPGNYTATGTYDDIINGSVHTVTFTSNGSITFYGENITTSILVVGGGGGGGSTRAANGGGGGGGGGIVYVSSLVITSSTTYSITVGAGGGNVSYGFDSTVLIPNIDRITGGGGRAGGVGGVGREVLGGAGGSGSLQYTMIPNASFSNGGGGGGLSYPEANGYTTGGGSYTINGNYYSGGGTIGTCIGKSDQVLIRNSNTVYGFGGQGAAGQSSNTYTAGNSGANGVVIFTFTL